jgi:hypothetical protein
MKGLADESISESQDISSDQLLNAAYGTSGADQDLIQRRAKERQAAFAGGGGAAQTQKGFGIGSAE